MNSRTKKLATLAILCAIAFVVVAVARVPVVLFLKYDPKDIVITIAGFIYGPMSAFFVSLIVSFVEMITISGTGPIGFVMNVLSSCAFACTAAFIYKKRHTLSGAAIGLIVGSVLTVCTMLLWNYFITPYYLKITREAVAELLIPAFLPFNVLKVTANSALTMFLYKPLVRALRKMHVLPESTTEHVDKVNIGALLVCALILCSCILFVLILQGIIK